MTGFGPGQPEVGSTGRVEYSQYVKVPLSSIYSWGGDLRGDTTGADFCESRFTESGD